MLNVTAVSDDFSLTANGELPGSEVDYIDGPFYLVDELGNYLVDESGNRLTAYNLDVITSRSLHSIQDDFVLNSE